jgi:heat shock protein HslJ
MLHKIYYLGILFLLFGIIQCTSKINTKSTESIPIKSTVSNNLNRVWMLVEFKKFTKEELIKKKAFLNMTKTEIATSNMGCNGISSNYRIKTNSEIIFTQGLRTEMACEDMKLEDAFLKILPILNHYKIVGHKLTLTSINNDKLIFIAQDWD